MSKQESTARKTVAQKIEAAFQQAGVRRTPQRYFVLERLLTKPDHATVEELWAALNRKHARASRATVYNTLHALVEAGLVREFTLDGKAARYDANLGRHHHFICDKCGAVEDVDWFEVPQLDGSQTANRNIRTYEVTLRGECAKCHSSN
jgi:Fur family transcriptional regulator, peroxide stress response regulator